VPDTADAVAVYVQDRLPPEHRALFERVRALVAEVAPEVRAGMRGGSGGYPGVPVFRLTHDIIAISPSKKGLTLSFRGGARFDDPFERLGGAGNASRTLVLRRAEDFDAAAIAHYVRQAVAADRQ